MPMSRKDKKRMQMYAVGAAAKLLRGGVSTAYFIAKTGIAAGSLLSQIVLGSSMAMADQICGVNSSTHIGDDLARGLSGALNKAADWSNTTTKSGITSLETWAKKKILHSR